MTSGSVWRRLGVFILGGAVIAGLFVCNSLMPRRFYRLPLTHEVEAEARYVKANLKGFDL